MMLALTTGSTDIAIMSAASDYTPKVVSTTKMKKNTEINIEFVKTQDILKSLGDVKSNNKYLLVLH